MGPIVVPIIWLTWQVITLVGVAKNRPNDADAVFTVFAVSVPLMYWSGFFDELLRRLAP